MMAFPENRLDNRLDLQFVEIVLLLVEFNILGDSCSKKTAIFGNTKPIVNGPGCDVVLHNADGNITGILDDIRKCWLLCHCFSIVRSRQVVR